ncbi:MAG TPA: nucleotide exchange factor GrpE [Xanthobacteraceae bacterium]|nr:nucleotide exchange factor GrpE [Xanthobacteraceae bacterium]
MTDNGARAPDAQNDDPDAMVDVGATPQPATPGETRPNESSADATETLAKEAAEFRDRWMRALAETENLRRRAEREVADARSYGIAGFARDMVAVADNMRRALEAVGPELRDTADAAVKALIEGVELTDRELAKALEKHGVRRIEPKDQKFDPHFHQAMFEIPDPSVPAGTVVQVLQDGYVIGERVLRPALVSVSKGGPKAPPTAANDDGASADMPAQSPEA